MSKVQEGQQTQAEI